MRNHRRILCKITPILRVLCNNYAKKLELPPVLFACYVLDESGKTKPSKLSHTEKKNPRSKFAHFPRKELPITSEKLFPRPVFAVEHENQYEKSGAPRNRCNGTPFRKFQFFKMKTHCRRDKHEADGQYSCHTVASCMHM